MFVSNIKDLNKLPANYYDMITIEGNVIDLPSKYDGEVIVFIYDYYDSVACSFHPELAELFEDEYNKNCYGYQIRATGKWDGTCIKCTYKPEFLPYKLYKDFQYKSEENKRISVSSKKLLEEHENNPFREKKKYHSKFLTVEGTISDISESDDWILLYLDYNIRCYFDREKYENKLIELNKGQRFAASGTWNSDTQTLEYCFWASEYFSGEK